MNQKTKTITSLLVVLMFWIGGIVWQPETTHWTLDGLYLLVCCWAGFNRQRLEKQIKQRRS